ncbi:hypothetical protein G6F65_019805 [Rhizopus arrhizus]|nr:hypothetical protein G6F65_019805 [Rhizopus arrhizus]KAG1390567.1 hypothetical protein G6F59_015154 [Rhizopus arrhizus]
MAAPDGATSSPGQGQQDAREFARILGIGQAGVGAALQATQAAVHRHAAARNHNSHWGRAVQARNQRVTDFAQRPDIQNDGIVDTAIEQSEQLQRRRAATRGDPGLQQGGHGGVAGHLIRRHHKYAQLIHS